MRYLPLIITATTVQRATDVRETLMRTLTRVFIDHLDRVDCYVTRRVGIFRLANSDASLCDKYSLFTIHGG